ncbi:MAG TPA: N-acetylneuraminate synthase [Gammaproteobacteria bacterium]|nr:N-acetylneuraminate synthase [Gammaproteobacteria bacterium]
MSINKVTIGQRKIGDNEPCFVTFEAGPTHNGVDSAKRLIDCATEAGADAIKFQIIDPDRLVADKKQLFSYGVLKNRDTGEVETVSEPLYDILKRRSLNEAEWHEIKDYADKKGLAFFATVGFEDEVELLESFGCHSIKIASADVNHVPLLRRVAKTGMCVQLDTGSSTLGEIEKAVEILCEEGNENIIIHQCPSGYPARLESINLNIIPTLKRMFNYPVAFSDHTPGWEMDVAAIALGANLVEKTITEDRMTRSVEHIMSIEPVEMKSFIQTIRELEVALGSNRRIMSNEEKKNILAIRRSVFLKQDVKKGQLLKDAIVEFRRPGYGIPPDRYEELLEFSFTQDLKTGHQLVLKDLSI